MGKTKQNIVDAGGNLMATESHTGLVTTESAVNLKVEYPIYGSCRVGIKHYNNLTLSSTQSLADATVTADNYSRILGSKNYELSNHLGNVLTTISDRKIAHDGGSGVADYYVADVTSAQDYYPFGMVMPGRSFSTPEYRFGFNGKEKDDEVTNNYGSHLDFGARIYDSRIGRWLAVDPLHQFIGSQYSAFANSPILLVDIDGRWIPGVDENGNIFVVAEKGDNLNTLYEFFGSKDNAEYYLPTIWTNDKVAPKLVIQEGDKVTFNKTNVYSQAMKDVKDNKDTDKYKKRNYNCHIAAVAGSNKVPFQNITQSQKDMDLNVDIRDKVIMSEYQSVDPSEAVFGETIITMGYEHSAIFFGKSQDGSIYVFSKDGQIQAPTISKVSDKIKSEENDYGYGPVRGINNYDGNTFKVDIDMKTGQRADNVGGADSGYYNKKEKK